MISPPRQSGTPELSANGVYDAEAKTYKLTLKQSSKKEETLPFHIPVVVGLLLKEDGSEVRQRGNERSGRRVYSDVCWILCRYSDVCWILCRTSGMVP